MKKHAIAVIGGGAAGMMAAITAASEGCNVTIFERNDRLGRKILATGNGKCNLSNLNLSPQDYNSGCPQLVETCLKRFGVQDTIRFFHELGLMIKDKNGYLYPVSEQASSVLDVLRQRVASLGVEVITDAKISHLSLNMGKIQAEYGDKHRSFDKAILTCGGRAASKTGSDGSGYKLAKQLGIHVMPTVPALTALRCRETFCKEIAGVRADAAISVLDGKEEIACERGELQLTEYGISGIPVFQLSRTANYRLREQKELTAVINFLPEQTPEEYAGFMADRTSLLTQCTVEEFFTGMLHKKLMLLFIKLAGLKREVPVKTASPEKLAEVFRLCRSFPLHITESNPFENAQVCAGGVDLDEVTENLESKKHPGIFFAGEILDVDGRCGGYNLQWAWSSGAIAGKAAAEQ